ncbi:hypothetical protein FRC02_005664 [Tulasnella sp. 418]|nr:hypothetical protein FRC02_005664 [Tulasnella sp. 418]
MMTINWILHQSKGLAYLAYMRHGRSLATIAPNVGRIKNAVADSTFPTPQQPPMKPVAKESIHAFDAEIMQAFSLLHIKGVEKPPVSLPSLLRQYDDNAGRAIRAKLLNESAPSLSRRPPLANGSFRSNGLTLVAHVVSDGQEDEIALASGFFIQPKGMRPMLVSCAHTLEQIRHSPLLDSAQSKSCTIIFSSDTDYFTAGEITASLPSSDIAIFSIPEEPITPYTLPVSMYPVPIDTSIMMPTFPHGKTTLLESTRLEWTKGKVWGYRDFSGRAAEPGSYDSLNHLLFMPPPVPGMSGAPLIEETSGAVIGIVTGSRMLSRVEGVRGWATPSETIFEVFDLL